MTDVLAKSTRPKDLAFEPGSPLAEALAYAQNQMRRRIDMFSDIAFEADASGSFVFLNQAWTRILGYASEGSLGHRLDQYVVVEEPQPGNTRFGESGSASKRSHLQMRRADGSLVWLEASIDTLSGGGTIGILRDVTVQKVAQQEFEKLSLVASYTDNLVVITDRHHEDRELGVVLRRQGPQRFLQPGSRPTGHDHCHHGGCARLSHHQRSRA